MIHIFQDTDVQHATIGTTLVITARWIAENISPILGLLAGFGGLIVVVLSIKEKVKKNRLLDLQIKEEEKRLNT